MPDVSIIGCGFVADLYLRSLALFPHVAVKSVYDRNPDRQKAFCDHWRVPAADSRDGFFAALTPGDVVLNLTNPASHFETSKALLERGCHVWSEKPLAVNMTDAQALHDLAASRGLLLASAPCSVLGEAAQTLGRAIRSGTAGTPRLIYAELDDGFIPQAPYKNWHSESGARWPWQDEFATGCTLEHAGYYLSWLIAFFGPVKSVVAASAELVPDKLPEGKTAPDFSVAVLTFTDGLVARLTCSIIAPHDHRIRVIGDKGVLQVSKAWDNRAELRFHRRFQIRRRLVEHPLGKRIRLKGPTHPKVSRKGAAAMNFALGPVEMLAALNEGRSCRLAGDFALHLNEVTLAIQTAGLNSGAMKMRTTCAPLEPMPWAS